MNRIILLLPCVLGLLAGCSHRGTASTETTLQNSSAPPADTKPVAKDNPPLAQVIGYSKDGNCPMDGPLPADVSSALSPDELHEIGKQRIMSKEPEEAVAILAIGVKNKPDDGAMRGNLGTALLQCGMVAQAVETMEKSVGLAPDNVDLVANLAQVYQIADRLEDAAKAYMDALAIAGDDPALHSNLAVVLVAAGQLEKAEEHARTAVALDPEEASYFVNLGHILIRQKKYNDAKFLLEQTVERHPDNPNVHNQMGVVLAAIGQRDGAIRHFKTALTLNPDHRGATENLRSMSDKSVTESP